MCFILGFYVFSVSLWSTFNWKRCYCTQTFKCVPSKSTCLQCGQPDTFTKLAKCQIGFWYQKVFITVNLFLIFNHFPSRMEKSPRWPKRMRVVAAANQKSLGCGFLYFLQLTKLLHSECCWTLLLVVGGKFDLRVNLAVAGQETAFQVNIYLVTNDL